MMPRRPASISRRHVLAGAASLGLAIPIVRQAVAQESTPDTMNSHPIIGTWVVDRILGNPADMPTTNVITPGGGLADSSAGADGVWEPSGPQTANYTLIAIHVDGSGYSFVRGTLEVDASGDAALAHYSATTVAPDGTVVDQIPDATATYVRIKVEPQDAVGSPFAGFPAWTPPPADSTPTG